MAAMIHIQVRYFAAVREALGAGEQVSTQAETLGQLRDELVTRSSAHAQALGRHRPIRIALDQGLCEEDSALHDGAEVAFFPPVTGG